MTEEPDKISEDAAVPADASDDTAAESRVEDAASDARVSSEPSADAAPADAESADAPAEDETADDAPVADPVAEEEVPVAEADETVADAADDSEDADEATDDSEDEDDEDDEDSADDAEASAPARSRLRRRRGADDDTPAPAPTRRRTQRDPNEPPPVVRAQARYVRSSARKARLVCDQFRGKSVEEARAILAVTPRAIARDWSKLLESAVANAEHNHELVGEDLYVKAAHADEGPTIKRFQPRAKGRATRIRKRTSHLTILLTPKD
jgi:ribosomal protein L22